MKALALPALPVVAALLSLIVTGVIFESQGFNNSLDDYFRIIAVPSAMLGILTGVVANHIGPLIENSSNSSSDFLSPSRLMNLCMFALIPCCIGNALMLVMLKSIALTKMNMLIFVFFWAGVLGFLYLEAVKYVAFQNAWYILPNQGPILYSGLALFVFLCNESVGALALAAGMSLAPWILIGFFFIQLPASRAVFALSKPVFPLKDIFVTILSVGTFTLHPIIDSVVLADLSPGKFSSVSLAYKVSITVGSAFVMVFSSIIYPRICGLILSDENSKEVKVLQNNTCKIIINLHVACFFLAISLIRIFQIYGVFEYESIAPFEPSFEILLIYLPGTFFMCLSLILLRVAILRRDVHLAAFILVVGLLLYIILIDSLQPLLMSNAAPVSYSLSFFFVFLAIGVRELDMRIVSIACLSGIAACLAIWLVTLNKASSNLSVIWPFLLIGVLGLINSLAEIKKVITA